MRVTNSHHFCKGFTLDIEDGKLRWTVDKHEQRFKFGTIRVQDDGTTTVVNPLGSDEEFTSLLGLIFEFTGAHPGHLHIKPDGVERQEILDLIYNQPLKRKVRLVEISTGGGPTITRAEMQPPAKTYRDLFKCFGQQLTEHDVTHYEYPDSVWLFLKVIDGRQREEIQRLNKLDPDDEALYIDFCYDR